MKNMRPLKSQQKLYLIFLEFATRYSPSCCVKLLEDNGKPLLILIGLLEPCNRSLPHMEVVSTICDIFISTSEIEEARNFLANWDNLPEIMNISSRRPPQLMTNPVVLPMTMKTLIYNNH